MTCTPHANSDRLLCTLGCCLLACCLLMMRAPFAAGYEFQLAADDESASSLVGVSIIIESRGVRDTVEINGKVLPKYSPVIIQEFPFTGVVLDQQNYVMTFLGYRWVDIDNHEARISITTSEGQTLKGKLIGIDQHNGVAVIKLLDGKLKKTPVCAKCEIKDGAIVLAPNIRDAEKSEYQEAQILSASTGHRSLDPGAWVLKANHPFPDIGLPILSEDQKVLGFIASLDPMGMQTVVYPIAQLLGSAEKILKANGDVHIGWLGIYLDNSRPSVIPGVSIKRIEEGSPAQKAGLTPGDLLLKYDGRQIKDDVQFVQLVQDTALGTKVKMDIVRQGRPVSSTVVIGARKPMPNRGKLSFNLTGNFDPNANGIVPELTPANPRLLMGLGTEMLTPPLAEALQLPQQTGLLVLEVASNLPADNAGVVAGDIILSIDGQPIMDAPSFASFLLTHNWNAQSVLKVLRKGQERTIVVQLPTQGQ
jgi:S1-C subfamily serine protease